jgi:hypothetical protein
MTALTLVVATAPSFPAIAAPAAPGKETPATAPPKEPLSETMRIVVFGDSQGEGIAGGLRRLLQGRKSFKLINRTKPGSAISQPLDYDWTGVVERFAQTEKADVAVMMFGGNDRLPTRVEDGRPIPYRSDAWRKLYRDRVAAIIGSLVKAGIYVIWCGEPIAREAGYSRDMEYLNEIFQETVPIDHARFLPLWTTVSDAQGGFAAYGKGLDGEVKRLRGDDGIHFTADGYDVVASTVWTAIEAHLTSAAATPAAPVIAAPVVASPIAVSPVAVSPVAVSPVAVSPVAASPVTPLPAAASPAVAAPSLTASPPLVAAP